MTILDPPAVATRRPATPAQMLRAAHRLGGVDASVVYDDVPWSVYLEVEALRGENPHPKLTYDHGTLELEMASSLHELLKSIAGEFLTNYMQEFEIDYVPSGEVTIAKEVVAGSLRPDQSYFIQNYARVVGRRVDFDSEPVPDLAIEIDLSSPRIQKASVYARLGVPEVWRWRRGSLVVTERQPDAAGRYAYVERDRSVALPDFPLDRLAAELARSPHPEQAKAAREFRRWCRERADAE